MRYEVAFVVGEAAPPWLMLLAGAAFLVVGALLAWAPQAAARVVPDTPRRLRMFGIGFVAFSVLWTGVLLVPFFAARARLAPAAQDPATPVVEGVVEDFHPMPYGGHDTERFRVHDVHFAYSDFDGSVAFHQSQSHGGPIHAGLPVRIHYVGTPDQATIVKLEIAR